MLIVLAVVLATGSSVGFAVLDGPSPTRAQEDPAGDGRGQQPPPEDSEPSLVFGSAAAMGEGANPNATVTAIEPIFSEPAPDQQTIEQPVYQEQPAPVDQFGEQNLLDTPYDQIADVDSDGDLIPDSFDNCSYVYNLGQEDSDGDGYGDACGPPPAEDPGIPVEVATGPDTDGDGIADAIDNCWLMENPTQKDGDGDGIGNGCDEGSTPAGYESGNPVEAERVVESPQLAMGEPLSEAPAPDAAPIAEPVADAPVDVVDASGSDGSAAEEPAAQSAADDGGGNAEERNRDRSGDEATTNGAQETVPAANGEAPVDDGVGATADGKERDRKQNKNGKQTGDQATAAGGNGNGDKNAKNKNKSKNQGNGDKNAGNAGSGQNGENETGDGGLSPVERGDRPRRNPNLTQDSGPIQPPPRGTKQFEQAVPGYEVVTRIDAGDIGGKPSRAKKNAVAAKDEPTAARDKQTVDANGSNRGDNQQQSGGSPGREADAGSRNANRDSGSGANAGSANGSSAAAETRQPEQRTRTEQPVSATRRAPAPIEEGVIIQNPGSGTTEPATAVETTDPGDGPVQQTTTGLRLGMTFGWQGGALAAQSAAPGDGKPKQDKSNQGKAKNKQQGADEAGAWEADDFYRGGEATKRGEDATIAGTKDDALYLTQRSSTDRDASGSFIYAIPVPEDGIYRVRLHFAETYWGAPNGEKGKANKRVFDVDVEGEPALENFDIYDEAGAMTALIKSFDVQVDDGTLELEFKAVKDQAVVSGIEVLERVDDVNASDSSGENKKKSKARQQDQETQAQDAAAGDGQLGWTSRPDWTSLP